jgi:hypothetical protein
MLRNNLISQFFILNFAFLTNFAIEKVGRCETIHLAHATWSPNESYHAVDQGNSQEATHLVLRRI